MPLKSRYNANFTGDVTYGHNVVTATIELAVKEINGVAGLVGRGVKSDIIGDTVSVDVFINVYNGVSCTDVAFRVQENIKRNVEASTKYKVGVINVNILGLTFKENNEKEPYRL
ncbi:MAG: Asp23/Gls24 family envelope stress response protein [Clostridiales bacterium]|jgi:uncharacterized alkaline shock family protein YloU|nr:Asp23/Gls24 family envelope stress response protein [Clostridiales bacterium]